MADDRVRLTYAAPRPAKRVRLGPWIGFLIRAALLLFVGLWLTNADLLTAPHSKPTVAEWMLRLLPLWIIAAVGGVLLFRLLRNRDDSPH